MALYSRVHVWVTNEILTASDLNAEFNNILTNASAAQLVGYSSTVSQMQQVTDPGGVGSESLAGSTADEIQRLRFKIKEVIGGAQWYSTPANSLTVVNGATITAGTIPAGSFVAEAVHQADLQNAQIIDTARIVDGSVTPAKRSAAVWSKGGAVTVTNGSASSTAICSVSMTTTGRPVRVFLAPAAGSSASYVQIQGAGSAFNRVFDGTSDIGTSFMLTSNPSTATDFSPSAVFDTVYQPAAGTYTWTLYNVNGSVNNIFTNVCLIAYEL